MVLSHLLRIKRLILKELIAITIHNITFQARVLGGARDAIVDGTFPVYLRTFFARYFAGAAYPAWCVDALRSVGVDLLEGIKDAKIVEGGGARWEYSNAA
jgi:queuine tRNA-ribosyltransferase catalytic subunit